MLAISMPAIPWVSKVPLVERLSVTVPVFVEELVSLFCRLSFALEGSAVNSFFFAVEIEEEAIGDILFLPVEGGEEEGFPPFE